MMAAFLISKAFISSGEEYAVKGKSNIVLGANCSMMKYPLSCCLVISQQVTDLTYPDYFKYGRDFDVVYCLCSAVWGN